MTTKKKPAGKARSAQTGRYVDKATAKKHPATTVVERVNPKHVVLGLTGLRLLREALKLYCRMMDRCCEASASHRRAQREIDRAITAHTKGRK